MPRWFRRKFSRKLGLAFSVTALLAVLLTGGLIGRLLRETSLEDLERSLTTQASLIENQVDKKLFLSKNKTVLHDLAHQLDKTVDCRITFIAADGTVLGDSALDAAALALVENHKERPEVMEATTGGEGHSVRFSKTVHEDFLYTAVPVHSNGALAGYVRLAFPLTEIQKKQDRVNWHIFILSLGALVLAFIVALLLANSLSQRVAAMSEVAVAIAEGHYGRRLGDLSRDEHGKLGETLNTLASRIQQTVQQLSHDKAHLSTILSNMEEAVVTVDQTGRITAVNSALSRTFGLNDADVRGKLFLEGLRQNQLNTLVQNVLQDSKPRIDEVTTFAPEERVFEAHAAPLLQDGKNTGALLVLHDITRIRRLEQVRRDFVANVSHELRTPLAAIKGFAETLREGALKDPKHGMEFVESIEKQTDGMTALVEDLLDLTSIESGQRAPMPEPIDLKNLFMEIVNGMRPMAERKKIKINVQIQDGLPSIYADKTHVKQIFNNLLDNAIKFNADGGHVELVADIQGAFVQGRVSDNGIGIPSQDLPRIFERFYRVDKARSRAMGGTGLGLSIVKHLAEANAGSVSVESAIGKGSTFTVLLPIHTAVI